MALFQKKTSDSLPPRRRVVSTNTTSNDELTAAPRRDTTFRRNRTLTGSSSPLVASTNELDAELRSPRAHTHHLSKRRSHILRRFVVALVACAALYILISQFIAEVGISSGTAVLSESKTGEYIATINSYFGDHPAGRLRPYLNTHELQDYVKAKHPEIASVALDQSGELGYAIVNVRLRQPVARWVIEGETDFVDADGVVFAYTPFERPAIEIINNNTAAGLPHNVTVSHQFLSFVGQVVGRAEKQGLIVTKATIPLLTVRQLEIQVSGVGYPIKLTTDRPAGEQVEDAIRVVRHLGEHNITPQYVDVRVAGRAFYK
ncbi:MAG: cell division protein FtsQ/DivIB [Candidatus Saccharimonadales bacterium]